MEFDFQSLANTFLRWINEGHEAILWLSGITGLSSTMILFLIVGFGRNIADFFIRLLRIVLVTAIILFALSWYVQSGHTLPEFTMAQDIRNGILTH